MHHPNPETLPTGLYREGSHFMLEYPDKPADITSTIPVRVSSKPYNETHCSAVIESAVIWVNKGRQLTIWHFIADKLSNLWYTGSHDIRGVYKIDRSSRTHFIHRNWPTDRLTIEEGHIRPVGPPASNTPSFPVYLLPLLQAITDIPIGEFDFDDVVAWANEPDTGPVCFRNLSIYYHHTMTHGVPPNTKPIEVPLHYWARGKDDPRFFLWQQFRARLLMGLSVATTPPNHTVESHLVFLRRVGTREIVNHDEIHMHLEQTGFAVVSTLPESHEMATLAGLVASAHVLCGVGSAVGNAVFLRPNSGVLELEAMYLRFTQWVPPRHPNPQFNIFRHDGMLTFLMLHHLKYQCSRNLILPISLRDIVLTIGLEQWEHRHGLYNIRRVRYDPRRILQLVMELKSAVDRLDFICNVPIEQFGAVPDACIPMIREQPCFEDQDYEYEDVEYSLRGCLNCSRNSRY